MEVEKVFHMNGGVGDTSYHLNSSLQKNAAERINELAIEAMEQTYSALRPKSLGIADLGCSSASNALRYIKMAVESLMGPDTKTSEFRVCLNDLPTNDFNTLFKTLPDFYQDLKKGDNNPPVLVAAYPGSFYGRLFPHKSLHFVFSFCAMQWLSRIPPGIYDDQGRPLNRESVYITKNSPPQVIDAYAKQFAEDFWAFLEGRAVEVVSGGRMALLIAGRKTSDYFSLDKTFLWENLHQSFFTLVSKGKIEKEMVESYDVHFYEPCKQEIQDIVTKEGSFELERFEFVETEIDLSFSGAVMAKAVRAVQQSMMSHHFGEGIMDDLFDEYGKLLDKEMDTKNFKVIHIAVVLRKL
ncbi:gibberellin A4 carboxyl methyltransferase [Salvia divinorum]|uniref:Gibberellin A4 carboxyl methyltransferase n=1 Tax=Salvia divinorum TaxID=28513 RepID=A0ABD1I184_SALDI